VSASLDAGYAAAGRAALRSGGGMVQAAPSLRRRAYRLLEAMDVRNEREAAAPGVSQGLTERQARELGAPAPAGRRAGAVQSLDNAPPA